MTDGVVGGGVRILPRSLGGRGHPFQREEPREEPSGVAGGRPGPGGGGWGEGTQECQGSAPRPQVSAGDFWSPMDLGLNVASATR